MTVPGTLRLEAISPLLDNRDRWKNLSLEPTHNALYVRLCEHLYGVELGGEIRDRFTAFARGALHPGAVEESPSEHRLSR